nr:MAG TPA: hypothetical protein [Caudoviricetes sp.]
MEYTCHSDSHRQTTYNLYTSDYIFYPEGSLPLRISPTLLGSINIYSLLIVVEPFTF